MRIKFNIQRFSTNAIPEALTDFRIYRKGKDDFIGAKSVEISGINAKTVDVSGAGILGEIAAAIIGHFESIEVKINWSVPTETALEIIGGLATEIEIYGNIQEWDGGESQYVQVPIKITVKSRAKSYEGGTFEAMNTMDGSTTLEATYLKYELDGKEKILIDKYNFVFKVDGKDQMDKIRKNLGIK